MLTYLLICWINYGVFVQYQFVILRATTLHVYILLHVNLRCNSYLSETSTGCHHWVMKTTSSFVETWTTWVEARGRL